MKPHAMLALIIPNRVRARDMSIPRRSREFFTGRAFTRRNARTAPGVVEQFIEQFLQAEYFPEHEEPLMQSFDRSKIPVPCDGSASVSQSLTPDSKRGEVLGRSGAGVERHQ
jgi:hypothetical protein